MDKTMEEPKTIIADDVEISGSIRSAGGVRIGGKLGGDLISSGDVMVEKTCQIKGNLSGNSIVVCGAIKGNITAKERVEVKGNARIAGDIKAKRLVVEEGVSLVGKCEITPSEAASGEMVLETDASGAAAEEGGKSGEEETVRTGTSAARGMVGGRPSQLFARK